MADCSPQHKKMPYQMVIGNFFYGIKEYATGIEYTTQPKKKQTVCRYISGKKIEVQYHQPSHDTI